MYTSRIILYYLLERIYFTSAIISPGFNTKKNLPVGQSDYETMFREGNIRVDKTLLLLGVINLSYVVLLVTRPRRTGKSINVSMLRSFLDERRDSEVLFKDTDIAAYREFCAAHRNQHPVIFISFHGFKDDSYQSAMRAFRIKMSDLYNEHVYLRKYLESGSIDDIYFRDILHQNATDEHLALSLKKITVFMKEYYKKKPYVIIDEYDKVFLAAFLKNYCKDIIGFLTSFYTAGLKGNEMNFHRAVMTGIAEAAKANIFSGLNHLLVDSVIDPIFPQSFGFTKEEVEGLIEKVSSSLTIKDLGDMYDGYKIGKFDLYNPYSVILSLAKEEVKPYWKESAAIEIIDKLLQTTGAAEAISLETLLSGGTIQKPVYEDLVYDDIPKKENAFWTLLVHTGYLNANFSHLNEDYERVYDVTIPSLEVNTALKKATSGIRTISRQEINDFYSSLETGDIKAHYDAVANFFKKSGTFHEWGPKSVEKDYHIFFCGLYALVSHEHYILLSNREEADGRYDLMIIPKEQGKPGKIYELKKARAEKNMRTSLQKAASDAVKQVLDKGYLNPFTVHKIETVDIIGVSFFKKHVAMNFTRVKNIENYNESDLKYDFLYKRQKID